jgi:putative phosphoribosyl transferase
MFIDRIDAGRQLAKALSRYNGQPAVVFALPRGGVVLGVEVARALGAPLDLIVVRKIGHPDQPEFAIGAVTENGEWILNPAEARSIDPNWIAEAARSELREARRRRTLYLRDQPQVSVKDKTAIVVDDGLATGLTMEAALLELRRRDPARIVVAVPVAAAETLERLRPKADDIVALHVPTAFGAVGAFYRDFDQLDDDDVIRLLQSLEPDR